LKGIQFSSRKITHPQTLIDLSLRISNLVTISFPCIRSYGSHLKAGFPPAIGSSHVSVPFSQRKSPANPLDREVLHLWQRQELVWTPSKLLVVGLRELFGSTSVKIQSCYTQLSLGDPPTNHSIRLIFKFFLSCSLHHFFHLSYLSLFFLSYFNLSFTHYSHYSVRTLEKCYFGLLRWASATFGVAFWLLPSFYLKSIGRIYRTCYLHESNRRWPPTKLSPFLAGPRSSRRARLASAA
jgi:hypothetical protein